MTDQKPNCGNCPNTSCWNNIIRQEKILTLEQPLETRVSYVAVRDHTKAMGCLSHPDAREYLMKDVIEELERLHTQYSEESELYAEAGDKSLEERLWGERLAIQEALTLIKGGRE